ncbi:EAL domain-containing protein [Acidihalobacter prosperus]|uniref:Diguanylate phosphodiesterase n=1 Tax=Acidihalobacter prosperus TaxID=160660 RepID=A0A1A6C087_9GAMM|nr:EAL domain-containing protein [Acidihalobacter prosperus]OBS07972.1 diguanylate phosphodiesterase [Acidihalobacter prosperus]
MYEGEYVALSCAQCVQAEGLDFDFTFAFQPIVDLDAGRVTAHEALVRGTAGESAGEILGRVTDANRYRFDQACRVKAVKTAVTLGLDCDLNINFYPNAVYRPELCIRTTLQAADTYGFPAERIVFEVTEAERIEDTQHLVDIIQCYRKLGFRTAIDDFGAGYAGLNLLAEYQPDYIKLDRQLIAGIDARPAKQAIARGIVQVCRDLGIGILAEGVETAEEFAWLRDAGIRLFQGYYFARPALGALPEVPPARYAG